jgi:hypothetical protein
MHATRRQIIDLAYRVDQQFAESLVELVDDDPARTRLKKRLEVLKLKNQMLTQMRSLSDLQVSAASAYAEAAWMLLGALHAGRIETLHHEQIRLFLPIAANLPYESLTPYSPGSSKMRRSGLRTLTKQEDTYGPYTMRC